MMLLEARLVSKPGLFGGQVLYSGWLASSFFKTQHLSRV
jgi:hypothetical protein